MLPEAVLKRQVSDEGGLNEVAIIIDAACLHMTTGEELAASLVDFFRVVLEIVVRALIDDGTKIGASFRWVTYDEFICDLFKPGNQFIIDRCFHNHTRSRRTLLSLQAKGGTVNAGRRVFKVCIPRNDGWVLAAEFQNDGANVVALGKVTIQLHTHVERTCKGRAVHFAAVNERLPYCGAGTRHKVEDTLRNARVPQTFGIEPDDPGSIRSGLDHDSISSNKRRACRSTCERKREVEGADD